MRILHLDAGREMRGGQWQVLRLIEGLQEAGVQSTLLARGGGPLFQAARERGLSVEPLGLARLLSPARGHDLVHAHDARSHTMAALALAKPLVVARRVAFAIGSAWKYGRADRFIAVSDFVRSVLVRGGVPAEKISVVYDGVPLLEPSCGDIVIAPANMDDPEKGAALAAEAARLASVDVKFSASLERDLPQARLFLYLTHAEGLGSAALLAMSAAVPVIASRVGGLPEVIRHLETGLLVENDAVVIAAAVSRLCGDPDLARRLGAAARRRVEEDFTVDRMVGRTMEVYRQVLK